MRTKVVFIILLAFVCITEAQTTNYLHSNVDTVSTTAVDTTFTVANRWEFLVFWFLDGAGFFKISADTAIVDKALLQIPQNFAVTIGPATRVRRLYYKAVTDTVRFFTFGYKKVDQ